MGIKKYALYFFGFFACFGLFGIIYAMNGGGDDELFPFSMILLLICLVCLSLIFPKELVTFWKKIVDFFKKHKIKFIISGISILTVIIVASIMNSPKRELKSICVEYNLNNPHIFYTMVYGERCIELECSGLSNLSHEECVAFFDEIETKSEMTLIQVISDGKTYEVNSKIINGTWTDVVYVDNSPMLAKFIPIECSSCHGTGRATCGSCNGKGKELVKWYSEGDWGFTSYTNYDCTSCDGRGHVDCYRCGGEGEYYNTSQ